MKKLFVWLLCAAMLVSCAGAEGLSGLSGIGGLPKIDAAADINAGVLPDPANLLGTEGTLYAEDYLFAAGYVCSVYLYQPGGTADFLAEYQAQAEANGYTVTGTEVEGYAALALTYGEQKALLLPEYDGYIMLLVENGMVFGEPLPEGNYLQFTRNGRKITSAGAPECEKGRRSTGTSTYYEISYYFTEEPITLFKLEFPDYAQTGDEFHVTKSSLIDGLYFYTAQESHLVFYNSGYDHQMTSSSDFFTVKITKLEKTSDRVYIEGTFEGSFNAGDTLYEDGSFRAEMVR